MKKLLSVLSLMMASAGIQNADAQIADGFYHIKNVATGRCISINDTDPGNYKVNWTSGSINLAGFRTYLSYDTVAVSPSCVIFLRRLDNGQYDLCGQGSGLYAMSSGRYGVDLNMIGDNAFTISATARGFSKNLSDGSPSDEDSWLMNRLTTTDQWRAVPINTSDEYIGVRPDVRTADGIYYGTIYAGFNFRLVSTGMAAFYVSNAGGTGFTMQQIDDDVIPAGTPVIVRCNSVNPEDNRIEPVIGGYSFDDPNWLGGVYCSLSVSGHRNTTPFDRITMRILGLNDKGELAFIANPPSERLYKDLFLMANKAYLKVAPSDADVMTLDGYTDGINRLKASEDADGPVYNLAGQKVGASYKGIVIQNGKKRIAY